MVAIALSYDMPLPVEPMRLVPYLTKIGGLRDDTYTKRDASPRGRAEATANPSCLRSIGAGSVRGLIKARTGRTLDDATLSAWEDGYLDGEDRPGINALLDAIARDLSGEPVYSALDDGEAASYHHASAWNDEIDQLAWQEETMKASKPVKASRKPAKGPSAPKPMSAAEFKAWRARRGLTAAAAAVALGVKIRVVFYYESGERPISRTIELLCQAIDKGF
jgi:DNA-binding transcriptional regulator YiaG